MAKLSQTRKIENFLKEHPSERFTARQIAAAIVERYPADYADKRANPRFADDKAFLQQIVAEIGAQKGSLFARDDRIRWRDKPSPRVYWFEPYCGADALEREEASPVEEDAGDAVLDEPSLYPLLMEYLHGEHGLYCQRINEKSSSNRRGSGGNEWLHPDIVALEAVDKNWRQEVQTCVRQGGGGAARLWSFEVKRSLTRGNVRRHFFQAVSNSSWAHEGYLVATEVSSDAEGELRMLSALHGIGVILLVPDNPSESELLIPARARPEADWGSVHRLVDENRDFRDFIQLVSLYYQTGHLREKDWNRIS